jgi:hypothetical protein
MTTLKLPKRDPETARGRKPVHTGFLEALSKAKIGQPILVKIPKTISLRGGKVATKPDLVATTMRNRMTTTANYHFREEAKKNGLRIKSSLQDGKLTFTKVERKQRHEKTSTKVASTAAKILKSRKASKAMKSVAASALTQAEGVPKRKKATRRKAVKK